MQTWDTDQPDPHPPPSSLHFRAKRRPNHHWEKVLPIFFNLDETRDTSHWHNEVIALSCPRAGFYTRISVTEIQGLLFSGKLIPIRCSRKKGSELQWVRFPPAFSGRRKDEQRPSQNLWLLETMDCILHSHRPTTHWHHSLQTWHW